MTIGFVYLLRNESMPGIYKIGYTDRAPSERAAELSKSTAVPVEFEMLAYFEIENAQAIEGEIHDYFRQQRVSKSREFFRLDCYDLDQLRLEFFESDRVLTSFMKLLDFEIGYRKWQTEESLKDKYIVDDMGRMVLGIQNIRCEL